MLFHVHQRLDHNLSPSILHSLHQFSSHGYDTLNMFLLEYLYSSYHEQLLLHCVRLASHVPKDSLLYHEVSLYRHLHKNHCLNKEHDKKYSQCLCNLLVFVALLNPYDNANTDFASRYRLLILDFWLLVLLLAQVEFVYLLLDRPED